MVVEAQSINPDLPKVGTPLSVRKSKRAVDILVGLFFLILCLPVFIVVITAILIEQLVSGEARGPLIYKELRVSHVNLFKVLKFRTVKQACIDSALASPEGLVTIKLLESQPGNLTFVGKILKNYYLDELPQLINVLRGDMSFVGPRPWPVAQYEAQLRQGINTKGIVPCGLTGLVQCNKGGNPTWTRYDLEYIEAYRTRSAWGLLIFDLSIVARSLKVIIAGKGI
jgi:lipopolysaccharide/colanic/teichoic acid biosynthesis glycosyltransferase